MPSNSFPKHLRDQTGREIILSALPERIVSLVPSITLTLFYLGVGSKVVGRTKFCIHPREQLADIPRVGGTKQFHIDRIAELKPDLIIANKEENDRVLIETLITDFNVLITDVRDMAGNYEMLELLGEATGTSDLISSLITDTKCAFKKNSPLSSKRTAYLIWKQPYMTVGRDTFIHSVMESFGLINVFADLPGRYPEITESDLVSKDPELIILSSEPYPFKDKHIHEISQFCPGSRILLADGEYFSWYGSRMAGTPEYISGLLSA